MDASAYLTRQGWRGRGHALHPAGHGLAHPLLLARKSDNRGVGKRKQGHTLADQWWSRAFDASLQTLQVTEKKEKIDGEVPEVVPVVTEPEGDSLRTEVERKTTGVMVREGGGRGLYAFFQKGEALRGTIRVEESALAEMPALEPLRKRSKKAERVMNLPVFLLPSSLLHSKVPSPPQRFSSPA